MGNFPVNAGAEKWLKENPARPRGMRCRKITWKGWPVLPFYVERAFEKAGATIHYEPYPRDTVWVIEWA